MIHRVIISGYRCFEHLDFEPNGGLNVVVGDNESGKSTLLEAIALALTGRSNGRWLGEELNPFWFHRPTVLEFFKRNGTHDPAPPPELRIELYLSQEHDVFQPLRGVHNSRNEDVPGVSVRAFPAEEYRAELRTYLKSDPPTVLPVEFYAVDWTDFSGERITRRPKPLSASFIDSRTIRSTSGIDFHTREILSGHLADAERVEISLAHRQARQRITDETLAEINKRIAEANAELHHRPLGLQMDQSSRASWETGIVPQVDDIPFAMAGQGQQAAIKIALAMSRSADVATFVLVEEPENHLSHTSLARLVHRISALATANQQLFVSTHSSYVLNRLGVDTLLLLGDAGVARFGQLDESTVQYFRKLAGGYDTLRLVLAERVVLVEGPSDAIVFERCFRDAVGMSPLDHGVDVLSMNGLTFKRALELCRALDREVIALRDNDGEDPDELVTDLGPLVSPPKRRMLVSAPEAGRTLEPQLVHANGEDRLREVLGLTASTNVGAWMTRNKTEAALRILDCTTAITYPSYIAEAVDLVR
jgi:putative ATP-dependent endonuclease of the OLD family